MNQSISLHQNFKRFNPTERAHACKKQVLFLKTWAIRKKIVIFFSFSFWNLRLEEEEDGGAVLPDG